MSLHVRQRQMHVGYAPMFLAEPVHGRLCTQTLSVTRLNQPNSLHLISCFRGYLLPFV